MRRLKITCYLVVILVLQTVVFARLNFFGVSPDLFLISAVIFAVRAEAAQAVFWALSLGLVQDFFSAGLYLNTIFKTIFSGLILRLKEDYLGSENVLILSSVAFFSLLQALAWLRNFEPFTFLFQLIASVAYNLLMTVFLAAASRGLSNGK